MSIYKQMIETAVWIRFIRVKTRGKKNLNKRE